MINICYGLSINTSEKGETIMLDFRMETFLTVCNDMNFTHAAEHLNLTQDVYKRQHLFRIHMSCFCFNLVKMTNLQQFSNTL